MTYRRIPQRLEGLRAQLRDQVLDGFVLFVTEGSNWEGAYYISGFRGSSATLLITHDEEILITDGRYTVQAEEQSRFKVVDQGLRQTLEALKELLGARRLRRVGFEGERVSYALFKKLECIDVKWVDSSSIIPSLRRCKDALEVSCIRKAAAFAASALEEALDSFGPGDAEVKLSALLEFRLRMSGAEGGWKSHEFIVASGERSALPHGAPTDRRLMPGEWLTLDYGARYEGYVCDITRNVAAKRRYAWAYDVHNLLSEAQKVALEVMKPGVAAKDVDAAARAVIQRAGFGAYFTHGLGHGIGLELHEAPRLSPSSDDVLQEGDVVTVEPGVYVKGRGGLRLEDDYLITADGPLCLTEGVPKEFFLIG